MAANGCYSCVPERIGAWKCLVSEEKPLAFKINRPKIQVIEETTSNQQLNVFISVQKTIFYMYMLIKEYFVFTIYDSQKRRKNILANEYITYST